MAPQKYRIGIWVALAGILMLFVALTSAYIVRQLPPERADVPFDWSWVEMPRVLWLSTAILVISSVTAETARRTLRRNRYGHFTWLIAATSVLGVLFLLAQIVAWYELKQQGAYSAGGPHAWFIYVLTGLHSLHLTGGLIALLYVTASAIRLRIGLRKRTAVEVTVTYWHFMDGLWVYLFVLLFFLR
jgi:cytochrome c oxidase subunit 3